MYTRIFRFEFHTVEDLPVSGGGLENSSMNSKVKMEEEERDSLLGTESAAFNGGQPPGVEDTNYLQLNV